MQTERNLKIYEMSGYQYKPTPTIMLKGQWLSELGFEAGNRIKVSCEEGHEEPLRNYRNPLHL